MIRGNGNLKVSATEPWKKEPPFFFFEEKESPPIRRGMEQYNWKN